MYLLSVHYWMGNYVLYYEELKTLPSFLLVEGEPLLLRYGFFRLEFSLVEDCGSSQLKWFTSWRLWVFPIRTCESFLIGVRIFVYTKSLLYALEENIVYPLFDNSRMLELVFPHILGSLHVKLVCHLFLNFIILSCQTYNKKVIKNLNKWVIGHQC